MDSTQQKKYFYPTERDQPLPQIGQAKDRHIKLYSYIKKCIQDYPLNSQQNVDILLIIENLFDRDLVDFGTSIFSYQSINEIVLSFQSIRNETDFEQQMKGFGYLISQLQNLNQLTIKYESYQIPFECFIIFLREVNNISQLKKLHLKLMQIQEFREPYNLKILGQELGSFSQITVLKLDLSHFGIDQNNIFSLFYGITDCMLLSELEINLKENKIETEGLQSLNNAIIKCQKIKDFSLELDFVNFTNQDKQIIIDMISSFQNLNSISLKLNSQHQQLEEDNQFEDFEQFNEKFLNFKNVSIQLNDKINQNFSLFIVNQCKNLKQLNIDLSKCKSNQIIKYGEIVSKISDLQQLQLKLNLSEQENETYEQLGKYLSNINNLKIEVERKTLISVEHANKFYILFSALHKLKTLHFNIRHVPISSEIIIELLRAINQCSNLQMLTIKSSFSFCSYIEPKMFHKMLSHNKFLNVLTFDFRISTKNSPITLRTQPQQTYRVCGTYLYQKRRLLLEAEKSFQTFMQDITNGSAFKKNSRIVQVQFLSKKMYRYQTTQDEEFYHFTDQEEFY